MMRDAWTLVNDLFKVHLRPDPPLEVAKWVDENARLPSIASSEHGKYRLDRVPYLREIFDALSPDDPTNRVTVIKGTQLGFTTCGLVWQCALIHRAPGPMLVVQPTVDAGKLYSQQRVTPTLAITPALEGLIAEPRSRDSVNTTFVKQFPGGILRITGANSATGLKSMPARFLHLDEIDEYPDNVDDQGDPLALAEARTDTYGMMKKILDTSTPTVKGRSKIERRFHDSDQRYYWVRCPHCQEKQVLTWPFMKWTVVEEDVKSAWYVCEHCGAEIPEHHKPEMLAGGEWIPKNPGHPCRGYHLSSLYSPLGWKSWQDIAREYLHALSEKAKGNIEPMISFTNNRLAETWEERGEEVDGDRLRQRAEDYALRLVPMGGLVLTASVDTQDDRLEVMIAAWGRGEECWVVDYTAFHGDPAEEDVWSKVDSFLSQPVRHESGQLVKVDAVAVDTGGHFTHEAYAFCRERAKRNYFACKGVDGDDRPVRGRSTIVDIKRNGQVMKNGVKLWLVGQHVGKNLLANRLKLPEIGPGYVHLSADLPAAFFEQMTAEHRVWVRTARGLTQRWVKKTSNSRNEAWDLLVLALFAAHSLDVHKYVDTHWSRLEEIVQPVRLVDVPQKVVSSLVGKINLASSGRFGAPNVR